MEFSRRKWGAYLTLYSANNFKIKLLWFRAGGQCSMQRHFRRSEIWCYLFGEGDFYLDGETYRAKKGSCSLVDIASWHQYKANKTTLVLEIQAGKCEESDIERVA